MAVLRNKIARVGGGFSTAVHWKAITAVNASKIKAGVVTEGARNAAVQMSTVDKSATYKDFGLDGYVTFEAVDAGKNFEDTRARGVAATMQAVMIEEEKLLLGGNVTAIARPSATGFTAADSSSAGPFTASTAYDFGVSALTLYGYINGATGHASADAVDETNTRTLTTFSTGSAKTAVTLTWGAVRGAVAYNVFIGTHSGTLYYQFTTTQTSITITTSVLAALASSGNVGNTSDGTADAVSFDGLIPQIAASAGAGYWKDLAGAAMSADNAGGITEWDAALQDIWNRTLTSPAYILVNAQEARYALAKITANGSTTTFRLNASVGAGGQITGGLYVGSYLNKFAGGREMPIITHGYLPPGTVLFIPDALPYPDSRVPNVFEVETRREYTQYDWALAARKYEYGVYAAEVLKCYFPAGCGSIVGIAPG